MKLLKKLLLIIKWIGNLPDQKEIKSMKKFVFALMFVVGLFIANKGIIYSKGADVLEVSTCSVVLISSYAWTPIPAVNMVDNQRIGIMLDMDDDTTNFMYIIMSSSQVPTDAVGKGFKYYESDPPWIFPVNKDVYIFGVMDGGAVDKPVYIQQLRGNF